MVVAKEVAKEEWVWWPRRGRGGGRGDGQGGDRVVGKGWARLWVRSDWSGGCGGD